MSREEPTQAVPADVICQHNTDGVEARTDVYEFECEITVFKKRRRVKLLYKSSAYASEWSVCL